MISENQKEKIYKRVAMTIELFMENDGEISDEALAQLLAFQNIKSSSSTVGRDLTSDYAVDLIGKEKVAKIKQMREKNKLKGNQKGGLNYALNNDFEKNETGQFKGSHKRRG